MPWTTFAYSGSLNTASLTAFAGVADQTVRVQGNDILIPTGFTELIGAYYGGTTATIAQLQSPSILRRYPLALARTDASATPIGPLIPYNSFVTQPIALDASEALQFFGANTAAGAQTMKGVIDTGDGNYSLTAGEIFTIRTTSATTLVANAWTTCSLTFPNNLPFGNYVVAGLRAETATGICARIVFTGTSFARPGAICVNTANEVDLDTYRMGARGDWGSFASVTPPTIEVLATAADTAEVFYLDLIKAG